MKTVYFVVIDHAKPLPESLPDSIAQRVYGVCVDKGQQVKVSVQEANQLEVREL